MRIALKIVALLLIVGGVSLFSAQMRGQIWGALRLAKSPPPLVKDVTLPPQGDNLPFSLPEGFDVLVFTSEVPGARVLARDPNGVLVVSQTGSGKIVALPDKDSDFRADAVVPILEDLNKPHGVVFNCPTAPPSPCMLYIAEQDSVKAYAYDAETMHATYTKTLTELPPRGGHSTRSLLLHPDGTHLLVATGSSCNVCFESDPRRAAILSVNLETGETTEFATGLRNTVFMTTHPVTGEIWGTDMGRDLLGDDIPPDEINIIREGMNYGWPICYGKNIHDTDFDTNTYVRAPCQDPFTIPSHIDIQAHSAPLGIALIPEEGWPEEYWFDALVAYHGSWNRSEPTGYKIVRMNLDHQGNPNGAIEDFMTGFRTESGDVIGRPADVLVEPGGTLWITDDRAGAVYRVFRTGEI